MRCYLCVTCMRRLMRAEVTSNTNRLMKQGLDVDMLSAGIVSMIRGSGCDVQREARRNGATCKVRGRPATRGKCTV
jgi:hypothetical protein